MENELKRIRMTEYMMSGKEFAKMLAVKYSTYNDWERGKSQPPLEVAIGIATKLNKKVDDIWHK